MPHQQEQYPGELSVTTAVFQTLRVVSLTLEATIQQSQRTAQSEAHSTRCPETQPDEIQAVFVAGNRRAFQSTDDPTMTRGQWG